MRLQPAAIHSTVHRTGNPRRPVRMTIGADLVLDLSRAEAVALADALVDATEPEEVK